MIDRTVRETVKVIGHAITRDLFYVVGGSVIVASALYAFDRFSTGEMPTLLQLFLVGISYVLGYAAQEAFGFLHITSTEHPPSPPCCAVCLYRRFTNKAWEDIDTNTYGESEDVFTKRSAELANREIERVNRIIMLKQIGTTMGACGAVAFVFLAGRAFDTRDQFDIWLSAGVLIATTVFIAISWVKRLDESSTKVRLAKPFMKTTSTQSMQEDASSVRLQHVIVLKVIPSISLARLLRRRGRWG